MSLAVGEEFLACHTCAGRCCWARLLYEALSAADGNLGRTWRHTRGYVLLEACAECVRAPCGDEGEKANSTKHRNRPEDVDLLGKQWLFNDWPLILGVPESYSRPSGPTARLASSAKTVKSSKSSPRGLIAHNSRLRREGSFRTNFCIGRPYFHLLSRKWQRIFRELAGSSGLMASRHAIAFRCMNIAALEWSPPHPVCHQGENHADSCHCHVVFLPLGLDGATSLHLPPVHRDDWIFLIDIFLVPYLCSLATCDFNDFSNCLAWLKWNEFSILSRRYSSFPG